MKQTGLGAPKLFTSLILICLAIEGSASGATETLPGVQPLPEEILLLRDPFKRPILQTPESAIVKSALQTADLESIKMIGVLTGPLRMRAILLTPDKKTHFVSENTVIGTRNGIIKKITPEAIYVRERIANILGQMENVDTEIALESEDKDDEADQDSSTDSGKGGAAQQK
ncbi:MAG: hypothetical protein A2X94_15045 [Bdellovibrionales bacterium GWB1_55_8]|nr:MAG: hypothetical protein A2X94_15045 [Bdellovibrionales bacterium GWB1_55_8]